MPLKEYLSLWKYNRNNQWLLTRIKLRTKYLQWEHYISKTTASQSISAKRLLSGWCMGFTQITVRILIKTMAVFSHQWHHPQQNCQQPLLLSWLSLIPVWISNHMAIKVWDEITYPFPNANGLHWKLSACQLQVQSVMEILSKWWYLYFSDILWYLAVPDSKVHGANMGPTWVLSAPDGPHVGPMNLAIWGVITGLQSLC